MRKLLSAVTAALSLAAVPLVAGCGAEDLSPESVAQAAQSTREAKTARIAMRVDATGFGSPIPISVGGKGVTALEGARMDVTLDLAPLLSIAGVTGDGAARVVVLGKDVYLKPPALKDLRLPEGADWVGLDVERTLDEMGIDAKALSSLVNADPGAQLEALTSAKGVKKVGEEKIGGVETTHFRGEVRTRDVIAALPPGERDAARKALEQLEKAGGGGTADEPQRVDVWVDGEERIRRMRQEIRTPAQEGVPAGRIGLRFDFSDFGTPLKVQAPPKGDVYDATDTLVRALEAAPAGTPG